MSSNCGSKIEEKVVSYSTLIHCVQCPKTEFDCKSRFQKCGGCKSMSYCSTECQRLHWQCHKNSCAVLSSANSRISQNPVNDRYNNVFRKWFSAVQNDLDSLLCLLFSIVSPLTHMVLICLKMNHDFDDRVRLSVRSTDIVQAFEMTSARVFTFEEFVGYCKSTHSKMINTIRKEAISQSANPDAVGMCYVLRATIDEASSNYNESIISVPLTDSIKAEQKITSASFPADERAAMCTDTTWFVEMFQEKMQENVETV